jgi:hypothetical protein
MAEKISQLPVESSPNAGDFIPDVDAITGQTSEISEANFAAALTAGAARLTASQTWTAPQSYGVGMLLDKGNQVFNVKAYGAVGDGSTNDYAAMQACANAMVNGGIMYFPASTGEYLNSSQPVLMKYSGCVIAGPGIGAATIKAGFEGSTLYANPGLFVFQSASSTTPLNNSTVRDISFDLNHHGTPAVCWWGCNSGTAMSSGFLLQNVEIYNRGADASGQTGCFAVHGDYSIIPGPLQNLTLTNVYIHDGDVTTNSLQTGCSILLTSNSLSHVLLDNVRLENVYGQGVAFEATLSPAPRYDWKFIDCDFIKCVQNFFNSEVSTISDNTRSGVTGFQIINSVFDSTGLSYNMSTSVADLSIYYGSAVIVDTCIFKNTRKVWNPGFSFPRGNEDVGLQFVNNIVFKAIEFQDGDGNFAARYSDNIFYQVGGGSFLGGYGRHLVTVISDNLIYNCCLTPQTAEPYYQGIFNLQEGGTVVEGNIIYNDTPQGVASAPTVAVNTTAGNLNGTYLYKITFLVQGLGESSGGVTSSAVTVSNQQVNLSNIPLGVQGCTQRNVYRTAAGGADGSQKLVATINDNTTTSYTDNIADSALGVAYPTVNSTTNGMLYIFTELSGGGFTNVPNVWKNNTVLGAGASVSSFYLDSGFSHRIIGNTGLTESTIVNSQTSGNAGVVPLVQADVVSGNYQANGQPVTNPNLSNAIMAYSAKAANYTLTASDMVVDAGTQGFGTALSFNGSSAKVAGLAPTTNTQNFTLVAWAYPTTLTGDYESIANVGNNNTGYEIGMSGSGGGSGGGNYLWANICFVGSIGTPIQLPLNTWSHVVLSNISGTSRLYLNGVYTGYSTTSTPITPANTMFVGSEGGISRWFKGTTDNVMSWNVGLTATQIAALYTYGTIPASGLVTEWLFNEGSGSTATDSSGNSNTGTITAATYVSNSNGSYTFTLPDATTITGHVFTIRNAGTGSLVVGTTNSQLINAATTYTISTPYAWARVISTGTGWGIIG